MKNPNGSKEVDQYISSFEGVTSQRLQELRALLCENIDEVDEKISYKIPCIRIGKYFVYYAGYKDFVSMYPIHPEEYSFSKELDVYSSGKATLRFPHSEPLPKALIKKIIAAKFNFST